MIDQELIDYVRHNHEDTIELNLQSYLLTVEDYKQLASALS